MLAPRAALLSLARALSALGAILWAVQGCSLTVEVETLQGGDSELGCRDDEKICEDDAGRGFCVGLGAQQFGCDDPSCRPCVLVGVEKARCDQNNKCAKSLCKVGREDCNMDEQDCEVETNKDRRNCGFCDRICDQTHAGNECVSGVCVVSFCSPGWQNCDDDDVNGCEKNTGFIDPDGPQTAANTRPCLE